MRGERDFTWLDGERLIRFGADALAAAPDLLRARGFDDYVLLTTPRFSDVAPALVEGAAEVLHVPSGPVASASAAVRDAVAGRPPVALGGGRVVDSAKAIAAADGLKCAAVTTTLSGAELTGFHRLPEGVENRALVRPALVIADPDLMASAPMPLLAATAMNALAHAVEATYTPLANPVATSAALRAAELLSRGITSEDRIDLSLGALLAAYASGQAGYAVHHVVCQTIVRVGGTPHAETNATMLPHTLELMRSRAPEELAALDAAIGDAGALAAKAGVSGLRAFGFDPARIDDVLAAALPRAELHNTPSPPGVDELRALVEGAL